MNNDSSKDHEYERNNADKTQGAWGGVMMLKVRTFRRRHGKQSCHKPPKDVLEQEIAAKRAPGG